MESVPGFVRKTMSSLVVTGILGWGVNPRHRSSLSTVWPCFVFCNMCFRWEKKSSQRVCREVRKIWSANDSKRSTKNEVQMIFQFLISTVGNLYDTNPKKGTNTMNISKKKYPYPFTFFDPHKNRKKISAIPYQPSPLPTKLRVTEGYVLGGRPLQGFQWQLKVWFGIP